jgi:predicted alpha/beta-hydrolase family hydrolase
LVKAVYLAGNSYPGDRALEERVTQFLSARLGISTYPQQSLIPPPEQLTVDPLDPSLRLETLATLIESIDEPVILIGRSSGGRIITKFAEQHPDKIAACICFGFPFQSPGQPPEDWRTTHLQTLTLPTLIIQGTRDRYGHEDLYERFNLPPRTRILHVDADHESTYSEQDWLSITDAIEKLIRLTTEESISQRCVFYLSGFDPRGARHYYELFKTELTKADADLSINERKTIQSQTQTQSHTQTNATAWSVDTPALDQVPGTHTDFQFLGWDDIVRKHWPTSRFTHWLSYVQVTPRYLLSGFFQKYSKLSAPAAKHLLSPNGLILLTAVSCVLIATLTYVTGGLVLTTVTGTISTGTISTSPTSKALLAAIAAGACWLVWRFAHRFETSRKLDGMMRSYAFTARQAHDEVPEMDARLDQFAQQIIERVQQNRDDEIIIVGHSSGAMMAVSTLARAIERYPKLFEHPAKIGLLTCDQHLPMLGLLPRATTFRSELAILATQRQLLWVDLSSASDPLCTSKVNPFDACGVKRPPDGYGIQLCLIRSISRTLSQITTGTPSLHRQFARHIPIPLPEDFHAATYLRLNPDVLRSGMSAEEHYRRHGAKERRPFCIIVPTGFDPTLYLALNPDVAQAGVDPLIHYTLHGVQENRRYQTT